MIGSFGSSDAYDSSVFKLAIERDPNVPVPTAETARYGKLPEIHHIFKDSPSNPPIIITLSPLCLPLELLSRFLLVW